MPQGPSPMDMNNMGMDPASRYYTSMDSLHEPGNEHDSSMTGMLEDGLLADLDNMPMVLDVDCLDSAPGLTSYTPTDNAMSQNDFELPGDMENSDNKESPVSSPVERKIAGVGARPILAAFQTQSAAARESTLTEFTKRRNWSQLVVEELKDLLHILTPDGRIIYLSPSCNRLTGYLPEELVGKFIVDFIHADDSGIFVREFNESIASGNPLRFFYRFRMKDGSYTIFESHGHPHLTSEAAAFGPNNAAGFCRGVFMMARPYPTKNAALLDSFLEHKIENVRLKKRIEALKKEEAEETDGPQRKGLKRQESQSDAVSEGTDTVGGASATTSVAANTPNPSNPDVMAMPPPAKPTGLNVALTRQNLEDVNANSKPDSINDKMARYEGASHTETIEMLTGLKYQEGERSQGISTGDQSPALIKGDAGITIAVDKESRASERRKKIKLPEEYVCTDCGTLESPEWRKGPSGPKTLCNACGLRWAKKEKKKPNSNQPSPAQPPGSSTGNS
ncbi:PYP-like sensor (PAS) [Venustampulla echinocandica]|uniref:PYP-like sensor (PAS) n=1 Tax=Venustampulla echinocandica TaxID=2656787 RepID=A0A370TET0_9HELO|nr:PYP-like sensor (PAS) [Venustampulla echinocandica]RDL33150.1 PYP-like sensor (PAS) [Venustampulla echinocandica]